MRPERILSELRKAVPEDGFIVTDVGWNKNGVGQQFPITVPGTFITPSGLATMGFGPAAVLGVKMAHPNRAAVALIGDGGFSSEPVGDRDRDGSGTAGRLAGDGQRRLRHDRRPRVDALRLELRLHVRALRPAVPRRLRGDGALVRRARRDRSKSADELGPALREALASELPTVIQAPMENAPTPTPGHWNINDIYRKGE